MNKFSYSITVLLLTATSLLLTGCAGQKAARGTARILVGQTTKLSSEIDAAIKVEETNYNSAVLILGRSSSREIGLVQDDAVIRSAQDFARAVLASKAVSDADIRDLLEKSVRDAWAVRKETLARTASETEALTASLKKLQAKTEALDGVRKGLESLQKEPSTETQGQELYDWSKKLVDGVKAKK
jgi:hypothetical protein